MDQTVNLDGFTERRNSNKGPAHTSSHDRLPSSDEVKACRKGLRSSWGPSTPAGRDARATVATTLMHHGSRLLDLNVPTTSIQADRSTLNSRKQDKRPADDSTSSSSSKKPRQSFEGAAPSKTAASKIAAHSNTASSKRTVASKIAEDRNKEIANKGEGQGISDSRFEAILFEKIYESHASLPDEMGLRHTIFCIQCLRKKSAHSEARDLKACMAVAGDINAPHGTYDSLWAIYLHWPSKRPPPVKGSKSKCPPQNPFETILDKGNASIDFVLNLLPDLESKSLMHDIYCQRQSITDPDGNRLSGTAPYDFDPAVPLHHAYATETLSASRARAVLVCGTYARKFFESTFNVPRNAVQGHVIVVDGLE